MSNITNFIISKKLDMELFGLGLSILLFFFFFILSFRVAFNISKHLKGWKLKLLVFLITVLAWLLIARIFWILSFFKILFLNLSESYLPFMYNIIFFLYLLQRFKRLYIVILGIIFLNSLIIFSIEEQIAFSSMMTCESEHPGYFINADDKGYYPIQMKIETKKCPITDVPYEITKKRYTINDDPNLMLVWDGKPHGFIFKWRVVAFLGKAKGSFDRDIRRIPEKEFQKLLKEQQR